MRTLPPNKPGSLPLCESATVIAAAPRALACSQGNWSLSGSGRWQATLQEDSLCMVSCTLISTTFIMK